MAEGILQFDPRTKKVRFSGAMRTDVSWAELSPDIRSQLEKPPHQAKVEMAGFPPVYRLIQAGASPRAQQQKKGDYTITENQPDLRLNPTPSKSPITYQITDPGLGYAVGNEVSEPAAKGLHPGLMLTAFGAQVPSIGGQVPDIDRNPYNFVALGAERPWLEKPAHPNHASWAKDCHSGILEFEATTLTPLFIPEGFPFNPAKEEEGRYLEIARHFFRIPDAQGKTRYAIPGSSLKGVLRSAVEALSNSRCGELNEDFYSKPIPYRRRVFDNVGILAKGPKDEWCVQRVSIAYVNPSDWRSRFQPPAPGKDITFDITEKNFKKFAIPGTAFTATTADVLPYRANLLYGKATYHRYSHVIVRRQDQVVDFGSKVLEKYHENISHTHYDRHRAKYGKDGKHYAQPLDERLTLQVGDLVFFTLDQAKKIDSFGKNVNYLWPAKTSVRQLAAAFLPQQDLSLQEDLSLAERMFGFSGRHKKNDLGETASHPYRGKIRIETSWGPEAVDHADEAKSELHVSLRLAPLTAPQTRAKSRPLYLVGKSDGTSATYDDSNPRLKGRKFYWHQTASEDGGIWAKHIFDPHLHREVAPQCPPPCLALLAKTVFRGRIHFDNLSGPELGCLLYALEGAGLAGNHALKIGKGKPRGMGSVAFRVTAIRGFEPKAYYDSLLETPEKAIDKATPIEEFMRWVATRQKSPDHPPAKPTHGCGAACGG